MKEALQRFLYGGDAFKKEFFEELRLLVLFTLGFTIAFSWRQTLFEGTQTILRWVTDIQDSTSLAILASIAITIVSVVIIWGMARYTKPL